MHVGRVVHIFYPEAIGDPFNTYDLSIRQSRAGDKATVFTWTRRKSSCIEHISKNFKILRLRGLNMALPPLFTEYPLIPNLGKFIKIEDPDIMHAHSHLFLTTLSSIGAAKKLGIPSIVSVHGVIAERDFLTNALQRTYLYSIASWIFRNSTLVICLTKSDANNIIRVGCPPEKIRILPSAVDTELFKPDPSMEKEDLIVWTGRFVPEKGLEYLVKAAKMVTDRNNKVKFLLIGGGPLKPKLLGLIRDLHVESKVFLIGPLKREEVAKYLAKASIFVFPSIREGMPKSVLEAMSAGKPVVASDIPGIREIIKDGVNGILVPPKNPRKLAEAILTLLEDGSLRKKLSRNARKTVLDKFAWDKILIKLQSIYKETIKIGY
ncbi:MAG: glycosyltransferase family 4 protein [Candidatus Njordarchaeales archaeon]